MTEAIRSNKANTVFVRILGWECDILISPFYGEWAGVRRSILFVLWNCADSVRAANTIDGREGWGVVPEGLQEYWGMMQTHTRLRLARPGLLSDNFVETYLMCCQAS